MEKWGGSGGWRARIVRNPFARVKGEGRSAAGSRGCVLKRAPGFGSGVPWPRGGGWAHSLPAGGWASVKGGARGFRPGGSSRACGRLAGCPLTAHLGTGEDSPRARHYSRRRVQQPCHLSGSLDPGECQFLHPQHCRAGRLQGRSDPFQLSNRTRARWVCPPLTDEPPTLGGGRGEGPDRPFCLGHF